MRTPLPLLHLVVAGLFALAMGGCANRPSQASDLAELCLHGDDYRGGDKPNWIHNTLTRANTRSLYWGVSAGTAYDKMIEGTRRLEQAVARARLKSCPLLEDRQGLVKRILDGRQTKPTITPPAG